jgi:hypothetical protein
VDLDSIYVWHKVHHLFIVHLIGVLEFALEPKKNKYLVLDKSILLVHTPFVTTNRIDHLLLRPHFVVTTCSALLLLRCNVQHRPVRCALSYDFLACCTLHNRLRNLVREVCLPFSSQYRCWSPQLEKEENHRSSPANMSPTYEDPWRQRCYPIYPTLLVMSSEAAIVPW